MPKAEEPDFDYQNHSYADYLKWDLDEMVELIKGRIFKMSPGPNRLHQKVSGHLFNAFFNYLKNKPCETYAAPFDVRLPRHSKKNEAIYTVVQPDICVICDPLKLDDAGCVGAPDLIVEILSPGNNRKELVNKYEVYEESGVKEYWVIHPIEQTVLIYSLINGKFHPSRLFTAGDVVKSAVIEGYQLDLDAFFKNIA
ncbi:Uma2 family endonuclease [Cyclobacterium jeungdonense]|uniref:Uma2 family endonuclease n=1 Tax=Cyclobacterium jeungdonense TaxID=708087 RepID=A0ABT8CB79_9BACT|nr:Uma2 family endonuclease [Cyclobacterium jeungdonense]MDN3690068.1 Uma2 family endonuclease [Cyclobacterium jeungdonense]